MKRFFTVTLLLLMLAQVGIAQRYVDSIDRGLVVIPANANGGNSSGNFISWRVLGEEYYDVTYNLYANGSKIASNLNVSNYIHTGGNSGTKYQVAPVVRGEEKDKCDYVTCWTGGCLQIPVQPITGRDGTDVTSNYTINDIAIGDLTGDGVVEFIAKRPCGLAADVSQSNCFHVLDAYDRFGNRLWWIDLGPNMLSGADEQWDCVCYDWDQDGKAEVLLRGQDNMIIHHADGTTTTIGSTTVDTRWSGIEYTSSGNEYLLYLEGATGKPYQIGPTSHPDYIDYPNPRGEDSDWGSGIVGHRSTKHYFGAPYLDGRKPSIFLGRGCYTKHLMKAFDVNPTTHKLTQRWAWECSTGGIWFGQGFHNFQIADVDWDGRDEIMFGSMVIDDNGKGLSSSGLGHGDAQHCSDLDPYRHGQEQYTCNETSPNCSYRNATTSKTYYRSVGSADDGRALMANFTNDYPGSVGRTVNTGWVSSCSDKIIDGLDLISWGDLNQRIYWDGDLCDEYFDSPGTEGYGAIYKPATNSAPGARWNFQDSKCNNWSKNNPGGIADIYGDWREELIMRKSDNTAILIYTTGVPTSYRLPTLWHDHQYRNAMVWQSMGYNQPPHKSYFLGEMEGITVAPPPLIMTGRTEVENNGTITTTDDHLLVCKTSNTNITIEDGASPYMVTFNVPSWVKGNAGNNVTTNPAITYTYYKCTVTGGALTGATRVVKQGDGILSLPKVDMTYTGETNIWAGTLNFDGTLRNSPLWLNRFAELNSDGGEFLSIKADYASIIRPGGANNRGSITAETLTLGFGSRLQLDLYSEGLACDQINTNSIVVETKSGEAWEKYGPQYITPVIEVIPHMATGESILAVGDYVLGDANLVTGNLSDIKIEGISGEKTELKVVGGKLILSVIGVRGPSTVYWTGSESTTWDYATAVNFDNAGVADFFVSGDDVVFDDAASKYTISLKGDLDPSSVTVNSSKSYTFSGMGSLVGDVSLVKAGTGSLILSTENTYTGPTLISGGTLSVSSLSNENLAKGNLGAVSTATDHIIIENGATLQTTSAVTMGTPIRFRTEKGGVIQNSSDFNMNQSFYGTRLTKKGNGWMTLYANNSSLDTLCVSAGTMNVAWACTTPAKVLELQGGSVVLANSSSIPIYVPKGKTTTVTMSYDRGSYSNRLTGEGTVSISYPFVVGSGWYADRCHVTGNWADFEGTVKPVSGVAADGRFCLNSETGLPKGKMDIASGVIVQNTGKTYVIGQVTGKGALGGVCTLGGSAGSSNQWQVGNEGNFTFEGTITGGSTSFVKIGTGKMTFKGSGDFTGTAKVNAGELCLNSTADTPMLGTGALTVANGALLSGTGTLGNTTTVNKGGILRSGISETSATGDLSFSGKNVTITGTIQTYLTYARNIAKCSVFSEIGTLKLNGTFVLAGSAGLALPVGTEIQVFDASKITLGANLVLDLCEPNAALGLTWDTSRLTEGILVVGPAPDGIMSLRSDELRSAEIYTLSGMRVNGRPRYAGVYVVDGKKMLLK